MIRDKQYVQDIIVRTILGKILSTGLRGVGQFDNLFAKDKYKKLIIVGDAIAENITDTSVVAEIPDFKVPLDSVTNLVLNKVGDIDSLSDANAEKEVTLAFKELMHTDQYRSLFGDFLSLGIELAKQTSEADNVIGQVIIPVSQQINQAIDADLCSTRGENNSITNILNVSEEFISLFDWADHTHSAQVSTDEIKLVINDKLGYTTDLTDYAWMDLSSTRNGFAFGRYSVPDDIRTEILAVMKNETDINAASEVLDNLGFPLLSKLSKILTEASSSRNYLESLYLADELCDTFAMAKLLHQSFAAMDSDFRVRLEDYLDACKIAMGVVHVLRLQLKDSIVIMIRKGCYFVLNPDATAKLEEIQYTQVQACKYAAIMKYTKLPAEGVTIDALSKIKSSDVDTAFDDAMNSNNSVYEIEMLKARRASILRVFPKAFIEYTAKLGYTKFEISDPEIGKTVDSIIANTVDGFSSQLQCNVENAVIHLICGNSVAGKIANRLSQRMRDGTMNCELKEDDMISIRATVFADEIAKVLVNCFLTK